MDRSSRARDGAKLIEAPERIPWVRPILDPGGSLLADIHAALSSGRVTNDGPNLREFERQLSDYLGVEDCVAVSSGSAALLPCSDSTSWLAALSRSPIRSAYATKNEARNDC